MRIFLAVLILGVLPFATEVDAMEARQGSDETASRPRARDIGLTPGVLPTGPLNSITDVEGVSRQPLEGSRLHRLFRRADAEIRDPVRLGRARP